MNDDAIDGDKMPSGIVIGDTYIKIGDCVISFPYYRALAERLAAALEWALDELSTEPPSAPGDFTEYYRRKNIARERVLEAREAGLLPEAAVRGE